MSYLIECITTRNRISSVNIIILNLLEKINKNLEILLNIMYDKQRI